LLAEGVLFGGRSRLKQPVKRDNRLESVPGPHLLKDALSAQAISDCCLVPRVIMLGFGIKKEHASFRKHTSNTLDDGSGLLMQLLQR
jgi:hypothetical protein